LALYVQWPGKNAVQTIVASKYLKWFGKGYRPLNYQQVMTEWNTRKGVKVSLPTAADNAIVSAAASPEEIAERAEAIVREKLQEIANQSNEVIIHRCSDKYSECKRFFDSERGLANHWRLDHGEVLKPKRGRPPTQGV